ncbi:MAG: hypothetical protein K8T25_05945 [Planctomycetia bacterium]|nr:hypothetical protein [Planctomycetia bacterium]
MTRSDSPSIPPRQNTPATHEFHSPDEVHSLDDAPSAELDADAFSAVDEHAVDDHHDEIGHGLLEHELAEHDAHDSAEHELAEHDVSDHGAPEHGDSEHSAIDEDSATATATARRPQVQKTRRKTGPIKQMIGIVVFGMMGIGLGYGILKLVKPKAEIIMSIDAQVATWWGSAKSMIGKGSEPTAAPNTVAKQNPPPAANPPAPPAPLTPPPIALQPPVTVPPVTAPPPAPVVTTPPPTPVQPPPAPPESLTAHPIPAAELETALAGARSAMAAAEDTIKPNVFFALCDLGHAVALVENPQIPPARALKQTAASVLRAAAKPANRELLGTYSHQWLFSGKRPADKTGVLLVGRVDDMGTTQTRVGELTTARVVVIGKAEQTPITVLTRDKPTYRVGDTVAILGSIVDDPAKSLPWYSGTEPKLVLSGLSQRLGDK